MIRMILLVALVLFGAPVSATQVVANQKYEDTQKVKPESERSSPKEEPEEKPRKKQDQPKLSSWSQAISELVNAARDRRAREDQERMSASKDP